MPFNKDNNLYSVTLNDNEEELKLSYDLNDTMATVDILKEDNKTILHVLNSDSSEENYVFYINKKEEATEPPLIELRCKDSDNYRGMQLPPAPAPNSSPHTP